MVRAAVAPHVDAVEAVVELLCDEEFEPDLQHEMIVVLIGAVRAEEIKVTSHRALAVLVLEHDDAVLHDSTPSGFIGQRDRSEVHQDEKLTRPEISTHLLVLMELRKRSSEWRW